MVFPAQVFTAVLATPALAAVAVQEGSYPESMLGGDEALVRGELAVAEAAFLAALERRPANPSCAYYLACTRVRAGDLEGGLDWLERAVEWGYHDAALAAWDSDLASLRGTSGLESLLDRMRESRAVGARGDRLSAILSWSMSMGNPHLSAEGERVLTHNGGPGFLWDCGTGELLAVLDEHEYGIAGAAFSENGRYLASVAFDNVVYIRDPRTGAVLRSLDGRSSFVGSVTFSRDGTRLLTGHQLWDPETGKVLDPVSGSLGEREWLSPDGRRVLSTSYSSGSMWDAEQRRILAKYTDLAMPMHTGGFSPNGGLAYLMSAAEQVVRVLDGTTGADLGRIGAGTVRSATLADEEHVVTLDSEGNLCWWKARSGELMRTVPAAADYWGALTPDPIGRYLPAPGGMYGAASGDLLWEGDVAWWPHGVDFRPDGEVVAMWLGGRLELRASATGKLIRRLGTRALSPLLPWYPAAGQVATLPWGGSLISVDLESGHVTRGSPPELREPIIQRVESRLHRFVLAVGKPGVTVQDKRTGERVELVHPASVLSVDIHPSKELLATGSSDGGVRIWDLATGALLHHMQHEDPFTSELYVSVVRFSPDGTRLVSTNEGCGQVYMWDSELGSKVWSYGHSSGNLVPLLASFTPDGTRVLAHGQAPHTPRVLDTATGRPLADVDQLGHGDLTSTPDGRYVLSTGEDALRVFDGATLELVYTRVEFDAEDHLQIAPSLHCTGTLGGVSATYILVEGVAYPLDSYASALLDPKKVRASCAGIEVSSADIVRAPELTLVRPAARNVVVREDAVTIEIEAVDPIAVVGFEVEQDGVLVPTEPEPTVGGPKASLRLKLERRESPGGATLRIRAVGSRGVLSRPALLTVRFD